ncbi:MAG: ABC transporter ATP-binding protein [Microcoleaceae cyanobacterium]
MNSAVKLTNVSKSFTGNQGKTVLAVDNINLEIFQGEFFSLLGPSGCGKTTTLRMIAGFELPSSGDIQIHHQSVQTLPPFHRPVNTVFQNYALFPHLTVAQNIAFGLEMENLPRPQIRERVTEALTLVKLADFQHRYPRQLSGGQQQRVALARALVKRPKVLLLDEPLGALDLKLRREMQLELKRMQQQIGITFIYVTHDQEEALTMSDRIGIMNQGILLQVGIPVEIYESPKTRFVADFIGESNVFPGRVIEQDSDRSILLVSEKFSVPLTSLEPLSVGQIVNLVIRPEKLRLDPVNSSTESGWLGTVQEVVYLGTDSRYLIQLSPDFSIVARRQNLRSQEFQIYQPGDSVIVSFLPDNLQVLQD